MKIDHVISQNRRDFWAIYVCESCGHKEELKGYDDSYFHASVIPDMECPVCGKTARDVPYEYRPLSPRYPEGFQI